jgi:hypothetical protein
VFTESDDGEPLLVVIAGIDEGRPLVEKRLASGLGHRDTLLTNEQWDERARKAVAAFQAEKRSA